MLEKLVQIFGKVQFSRSTHNKYIQILMGIYEKSSVDEFVENFMLILRKIFEQDMDKNNLYIKRALEFFSKFSAEVVRKEISNENEEIQQPAVFLPKLLEQVFQYCDLNYLGCRYYSCSFIMKLLDHIGGDVNLDNSVCDMIEEAMLKRLEYDNRLDIRLQAISALSRLQSPTKDCPIIEAYLKCLNDQHNTIRRAVIDVIVLNAKTLPAIRERIHDIDAEVRCRAYIRLANMGPLVMFIRHRLFIMRAGLTEENPQVKRIFKEVLLTKWLIAYDNDYTKFLKALTLSSTEIDLTHLAPIGKKILRYLFELASVDSLLESLPIDDENKLIKDTHFNNETLLYWYYLIKYFRTDDRFDDYLSQILPDLTQFCLYIERKFNDKYSRGEVSEFEFNIHCLLKILNGYDFSEEVGRRTTITLITNIITKYQFNKRKLTEKFLRVLSKCYTKLDNFLDKINEFFINIREPTIEIRERLSEHEITDRRFKIAHCRTRIIILQGEQEEAVTKQNFQKAGEIQINIDKLNEELEDLEKQFGSDITTITKTIRVNKTDGQTISNCLDILIGVMRLKRIDKLSPILIKFMDELLLPLSENQNDGMHAKYLECLILYCVIDKKLALKYHGEIFDPILSYKHFGYSDLASLKIALMGFADLLCIYGINLMKSVDSEIVNTTRRLIQVDNGIRNVLESAKSITFPLLLDSIVAILDIEDEEMIIMALKTLCKLVSIVQFTSEIISHVLLKWFHPITEKNNDIYTTIGFFIERFIKLTKNSIMIIRETLVPVLSTIVTSPNDYPMTSVNLDIVLNFYLTLMNADNEINLKTSIFDIIEKISDDSNKKIVQLLSKILLRLDVKLKKIEERHEYIEPAVITIDKIEDKVAKRYIEKFISKVKSTAIANESQPVVSNKEQHNDHSQGNMENETNNNNVVEDDQNGSNNNNRNNTIVQNKKSGDRSKLRRSQRLQARSSTVGETAGVAEKKKIQTPIKSNVVETAEAIENKKIQTPAKSNAGETVGAVEKKKMQTRAQSNVGRASEVAGKNKRQTPAQVHQIKRRKSKRNKSNIQIQESPVSSTSDRNVEVISDDTSDTDHSNTGRKVPLRKSLRLSKGK